MSEWHTASLLLHLAEASAAAITARVHQLGCETHGNIVNGKLIVTLEADDEARIGKCLTALQLLPGVYAATLVFHHVETIAPDASAPATETQPCA